MMCIECPGCAATAMIGKADGSAANDDERLSDWEAPDGFRKVQFGPGFDRLYLYCTTCGVPAHIGRPRLVSNGVAANREGEA